MDHAYSGAGIYAVEPITWREWVTLQRIRRGISKADLAKATGIGRTRLWEGLDLPPTDRRHVPLTSEQVAAIENALGRTPYAVAS